MLELILWPILIIVLFILLIWSTVLGTDEYHGSSNEKFINKAVWTVWAAVTLWMITLI